MQTRSEVVVRRTYSRPTNEAETTFESWEDICTRVTFHQRWLWERAKGSKLSKGEIGELEDFRKLMVDKKVSVSGRTLWLGGTEIAKKREASQFNCAGTVVETVYDIVDVLWLLMQGTGVGFKPTVGTLNGFTKPIKDIQIVRSTRTTKGGSEVNTESWDKDTKTWTITVGDSAEAWAKSIGKLLAGKYPANKLVLDFSELRPAGERLKGYGWISSGDSAIAKAYEAIAVIMNKKAGQLLSKMDILDVVNWLGTILSSRRSAQIALFEYNQPEWEEFALAKREYWIENEQRVQSNNSLLFFTKPSKLEMQKIFKLMEEGGGSEPAFINAEEALRRAPWFKTCNPCVEILLANKSFCNLVEVDIAKFRGDTSGLLEALRLAARA
ncbi:MAG: ribonucleoside-triphosphate reductase, adenosylcobalamin-dependent, partial [Dehalococcoidia bacterium]|nr:ribonucleoside-triphosphate reductase, adenosylcobalamin-dependent [Dehalococcoidia bacterium]